MAGASKKPALGHWLPALITSVDQNQNQNQQGRLILKKWSINMTLKRFATQQDLQIFFFFSLEEEQYNKRWIQLMTKFICSADSFMFLLKQLHPPKKRFSSATTDLALLPRTALATEFFCLPQFTSFSFSCAWGTCVVTWVSLAVPSS